VLQFENFILSGHLHHYYNGGNVNLLRFNGKPVANGMKITVFGPVEDRSFDGNGTYLDLKGAPSIGRPNGVVRVYMPASEFNKLQSDDYLYKWPDTARPTPPEVAVEGTLVGLNRYGNLEIRDGRIRPWMSVLLPPRTPQPKNADREAAKKTASTTIPSGRQRPVVAKPLVTFVYPPQTVRTEATFIHDVDFRNFSYPWIDFGPTNSLFLLRSGKSVKSHVDEMGVSFSSVRYGDLTGDGIEEALVLLDVSGGGSATWDLIYVYALQGGRLVLLAGFQPGERADGGLRRVAVENGELVLDLNELGDSPHCCPAVFTTSRYRWTAGQFVQTGEIKRTSIR
jgi:hypothetical protein